MARQTGGLAVSHLNLVTPKKHLIRESYADFILSRHAMLRTPKTIQFYEYTVGGFVEWLLLGRTNEPDQIKSHHVRAFLAETAQRGVKDSTVHAFARGIRAFIRFIHEEGYIENPIKVSMPKVAKKRLPLLSVEELRITVNSCTNIRDKALVMVLADSGIRSSELCALTWGDVNLKSGAIRVRSGKGGKDRMVIIGIRTRRVLMKQRRTVPNDDNEPLFNLKPAGLRMALLRLGRRAGIHLTAHMFRRTFATLSLRAGINPLHLQGLMGHATLEQTRKYIELVDEDLLKAHREYGPVDRFLN